MKRSASLTAQAETLERRALTFRVLALALAYPEPGHPRCVEREFRAVRAAHPCTRRIFRDALLLAWREASEEAFAAQYTGLFLKGSSCPMRETAYGDARRMNGRPVELADIAGFYRAFGLEPSETRPGLPDFLPTELEFYSLLSLKERYAIARRWPDRRAVCAQAARAFLEQHLGRWVGAFAEAVRAQTQFAPYRELVRSICDAVAEECRALRVRPTPVEGLLPYDPMQAEHFSCAHEASPRAAP